MTHILLILVTLGLLSIVVEDIIHIDKAKTTLFFGSLVWFLYFMVPGLNHAETMHALNENLLDIATLWLFLMAAMTFVSYLSSKGVIDGIVNRFLPEQISERKLMFLTGFFAFGFSSMADNITTALVCITVLLSLNLPAEKLLRYLTLMIFSINAGGAALITGDVTTLMIFLAGKVEIMHLLLLAIPGLIAVIILAWLLSLRMEGNMVLERRQIDISSGDKVIATLFLLTIFGTIGANIAFGIPPVLSFLLGLSLMFMVVQFLNKDEHILDYIRRIEFDALIFFLGVLLLVGMLKELGILAFFPDLYQYMPATAANYIVGLLSSLIDNVPMTAALLKSGVDMSESEWLTLTYSVGVGGSLLIIGSAAGIVTMSKIKALTFASYLRYFIYLIIAYTAGFCGTVILGTLLESTGI